MIIYSSISRNDVILTEHSTGAMNEASVNLVTITQMVLSDLAREVEEGTRRSFRYNSVSGKVEPVGGQTRGAPAWTSLDIEANSGIVGVQDFFYHLVKELHGVIYLCLTDDSSRIDKNYRFLEDLSKNFNKKFGKRAILKANAYAMEKKFASKIGELVHHFNTHPDNTTIDQAAIDKATAKVEATKEVMGNNIRQSLHAQETAQGLQRTSALLRQNSMVFRKKSTTMRRTMQCEYWKLNWAITVGILIFIYLCIAYHCGLAGEICLEKMKQRHNNSNINNDDNNDKGGNNVNYYEDNSNYDDIY